MWDKVKNLFSGKAQGPEPANPKVQPGWEILGGLPNWVSANSIWKTLSTAEKENLYKSACVVFSCVRKICLTIAEAPLRVGLETKDGWTDDEEHWAHALLQNPAPGMSGGEFLWHWQAHLQLTGASFVWKWRNGAGNVTELWPIPSSWVKPKADGSYLVWQGQNKPWLPVPKEDMFRVIYPDPSSLTGWVGPLQAACRPVQMDQGREDYQMEMMENNRQPGLIFTTPGEWSEPQKEELRSVVQNQLSKGNRGRPLFLEGMETIVKAMETMKDVDQPGITSLTEARICSAFDVPPILIGLRAGLDASTYSNFEQAKKAFYQGTMLPLWAQSGIALTHGLLYSEGDKENEVYHNVDHIAALAEDADKRTERAKTLYLSGLTTRNQSLRIAGEDPAEHGGDNYFIPMNGTEVPAAQLDEPPETPSKDDGKPNEAAP